MSKPAPPLWLLALALVASGVLAGCAQGPRTQADPHLASPTLPGVTSDVRPSSVVTVGPNETVSGPAHQHDWWGGERTAIVMDRDLASGPADLCYGYGADPQMSACQSAPADSRTVRFDTPADQLGPPNNVWPGTGSLVLDITLDGQILHPFDVGVHIPRGGTWQDNLFPVGENVVSIALEGVEENQTDPPHFRGSGWSFKILPRAGDAGGQSLSLYEGTMHWTVTIHRSDRPLPIDPPHPDRWAGAPRRVLLDETMRLDARQLEVGPQFVNSAAPGPFGPPPDQTVLPGTHRMTARLEWTNELPHPTQLALKTCDPTGTCGQNNGWTFHPPQDRGDNWSAYEIEVRPDQWDFVYATKSLWMFHFEFENEDLSPAIGRSGLFRGTVRIAVDIQHGDVDAL